MDDEPTIRGAQREGTRPKAERRGGRDFCRPFLTALIDVLRVTADTNILISGLNFVGIPRQILNLCKAGASTSPFPATSSMK